MSIHAVFDRFRSRCAMTFRSRGLRAPASLALTGTAMRGRFRRWSGKGLILGLVIGCAVLTSCSRSQGVFEGVPIYSGVTPQDVPSVVECIAERWKRSTRGMHRSNSGAAVRLQGETFFRGVPIGARVFRAAGRTHVQFFQERSTDHIYMSFIKGCL